MCSLSSSAILNVSSCVHPDSSIHTWTVDGKTLKVCECGAQLSGKVTPTEVWNAIAEGKKLLKDLGRTNQPKGNVLRAIGILRAHFEERGKQRG